MGKGCLQLFHNYYIVNKTVKKAKEELLHKCNTKLHKLTNKREYVKRKDSLDSEEENEKLKINQTGFVKSNTNFVL